MLHVVFYDTCKDLRPTDGSKRTYHCLVFPANDIYDLSSYSIYSRYKNHLTLKMTSAEVVETSVNVISNSPYLDYSHLDDSTSLNYENFNSHSANGKVTVLAL